MPTATKPLKKAKAKSATLAQHRVEKDRRAQARNADPDHAAAAASFDVAPRISVIVTDGNYVGALQEAAVREGIAFPVYEPDGEEGPAHSKRFGVRVTFHGRPARGMADTKKSAKTTAAMCWAHDYGDVAEK